MAQSGFDVWVRSGATPLGAARTSVQRIAEILLQIPKSVARTLSLKMDKRAKPWTWACSITLLDYWLRKNISPSQA